MDMIQVDMSKALVHKGSVLYEEQKGKWRVRGSCTDKAARAVTPLITPSLSSYSSTVMLELHVYFIFVIVINLNYLKIIWRSLYDDLYF